MRLTNYPFDRALVAERQRDRPAHSEQMRRTGRHRGPGQKRHPTTRSRFASWLRGPAPRSHRAAPSQTTAASTRP
jgi:hypothetical protein